MSASLRSLPKFGTAANRRGVPFAVIREAIRALNSQEHPAASNDIATGRVGELLFWKLVRCNTHFAPPLSSASLSQTNLVKAHERECFGNIASLGAVLRQSPNMWRTMLSPSF